jgi:hypothetical protein
MLYLITVYIKRKKNQLFEDYRTFDDFKRLKPVFDITNYKQYHKDENYWLRNSWLIYENLLQSGIRVSWEKILIIVIWYCIIILHL